MIDRSFAWFVGVVCLVLMALVGFQVFLRYQYVQAGDHVTRIDRVTGASCQLPCTPPPPTPAPTPFDKAQALREFDTAFSEQTQAAISAAQAYGQSIAETEGGSDWKWGIDAVNDPTLATRARDARASVADDRAVPAAALQQTAVRLICFCDDRGSGYRWEVNTLTDRVTFVNDNADLTKKYHLGTSDVPQVRTPTPMPIQPIPTMNGPHGAVPVPASVLAHPPTAPPTPIQGRYGNPPTPPPAPPGKGRPL